jgi:hypothetical protein
MNKKSQCEYCGRPIKGQAEIRVRRGIKHTFCTEFCFRLYFFDVPTITYSDLQKMYELRCVTIKAPDFRTLVYKED